MSEVSIDRLESAMRTVASLIQQSGDDFWPVFDRLEAERNVLISRKSRLSFYLSKEHTASEELCVPGRPAFRPEGLDGDQPQRNRLN